MSLFNLNLNLSLTLSLTEQIQYSKGFQLLVKDVKDKINIFSNRIYIYTHTHTHTHYLYNIIKSHFFNFILNPMLTRISA